MTAKLQRSRSLDVLALGVVFLMMAGCGSQGPFEYVPVSGKVVYEDGSPVPSGQVFFVPEAAPKDGFHPRTAAADIGSDGTFASVTSYKPGDGLIPGKHKVAIQNAYGPDGSPLVPEQYSSFATTPLEIDTADAPLVITVPKP